MILAASSKEGARARSRVRPPSWTRRRPGPLRPAGGLIQLPGIRGARPAPRRLARVGRFQAPERPSWGTAGRPRRPDGEMVQQSVPPGRRIRGAEVVDTIKQVARQGFALGLWARTPRISVSWSSCAAATGRRSAAGLELAAEPAQAPGGNHPAGPNLIEKAGRTLHPLNQQTFWWFEKGDLVLTNQSDVVLAVLDGKKPSAVDHPVRTVLQDRGTASSLPPWGSSTSPRCRRCLPMRSARARRPEAIEFASGFEGDALRTVLRAVAPAPRRGLLALLDQPTFDARSLPPLPAGLTGFTVLRSTSPRPTTVPRAVKEGESTKGRQCRRDRGSDPPAIRVRAQGPDRGLGPKLAVYVQTPAGDAGANRAAMMITQFPGLTSRPRSATKRPCPARSTR